MGSCSCNAKMSKHIISRNVFVGANCNILVVDGNIGTVHFDCKKILQKLIRSEGYIIRSEDNQEVEMNNMENRKSEVMLLKNMK